MAEHYARSPRGLVQQFTPDEAAWPLRPSDAASTAQSQLPSVKHAGATASGASGGIPMRELTELSLLRGQPGTVHSLQQQRDVSVSLSELAALEAKLANKMAALGRMQSCNHSPRLRTGPTPALAVGASPRAGRRRLSQEAERLMAAGTVMRNYEDPTMHWEWHRPAVTDRPRG